VSLSGPSLDLIAPIRPLQPCADGGYQLRLGVLGVPLIMVPDGSVIQPIVVVRGNEMALVILGLLSSISTSISDLNCDPFKMLINPIFFV
jgi:hypothetical protein